MDLVFVYLTIRLSLYNNSILIYIKQFLYQSNSINLNLMFQSQNIRQQSLQLLRDQAGRLKLQNRQIELRDDQIRFLKETVLALEQEKDSFAHQNNQLKNKLKIMAAEITNYNSTVVQKIYNQNEELSAEAKNLREQNENMQMEIVELNKRLKESEGKLLSQCSEKVEVATAYQSLKQNKSKNQKKLTLLQKENKQLQIKNISLQRQLDDSSNQINYCSQQIDVLTQKHHESLKTSDKKLKQLMEKMVSKEDYERIDKELKDGVLKNKQLRMQNEKGQREIQKLKFQVSSLKDKLLSFDIKEETKSQQLKIDLINLRESVKIGKKIAEFESEQHQTANSIYELYKSIHSQLQKLKNIEQQMNEKLKLAELQILSSQEQIQLLESELSHMRERNEDERNTMEAEYQNKIMEISMRLKQQEVAMAGLKNKQCELQNLREQFQREGQQHNMQKQAMSRTLQQLKKQNFKLSQQMSGALKLCEENMWSRECVNKYKYMLQDLVGVCYYLYLLLIRQREKVRKIYYPFINYFLAIHPSIRHIKTSKLLLKFRAAVHVLVALQRMKKDGGKGKGIEWHASCAVERRYKVQHLGVHVQNISITIMKGGNLIDVLKMSGDIYKWKIENSLWVQLPTEQDLRQLSSGVQLELD